MPEDQTNCKCALGRLVSSRLEEDLFTARWHLRSAGEWAGPPELVAFQGVGVGSFQEKEQLTERCWASESSFGAKKVVCRASLQSRGRGWLERPRSGEEPGSSPQGGLVE